MRNRFLMSIVAIVALVAVLGFSSASFAQTDAKTTAKAVAPRDFSGVWMASSRSSDRIHEAPDTFLKPAALAQLNAEPLYLRRDLYAATTVVGSPGVPVLCSEIGLTDFIEKLKPIEIVQTPQRIFMFFEYEHTYRTIWMDGRALPKDPDPSYFGQSVGKWDGNTLVVETVGFNDRTQLNGMPHSDAAHLVERYTRKNNNTLELTMTADDSKAYTKPWTAGPIELALHPDWNIEEEFCIQEDNDALQKNIIDPSWKGVSVSGQVSKDKDK